MVAVVTVCIPIFNNYVNYCGLQLMNTDLNLDSRVNKVYTYRRIPLKAYVMVPQLLPGLGTC